VQTPSAENARGLPFALPPSLLPKSNFRRGKISGSSVQKPSVGESSEVFQTPDLPNQRGIRRIRFERTTTPLLETLCERIRNLSSSKDVVFIGIDGVGGAGKTTLAQFLRDRLDHCRIVQLDDFYSPALQAADVQRLKEQVLWPIQNRREARFQIYEWETDSFSDWRVLRPEGVFLFEGVYALEERIRAFYDLKLWVEYPAELGFRRGIARDIAGEGRDISNKWKNVWMPLEEKYRMQQEPDKSAEYIINGENFTIIKSR
jgi:uridine kinase